MQITLTIDVGESELLEFFKQHPELFPPRLEEVKKRRAAKKSESLAVAMRIIREFFEKADEIDATDILYVGEVNGLSKVTMHRARNLVGGIVSVKRGAYKWFWIKQ